MGAVNLSHVPIEDQRLVFMGAGSAGVGVAKQMTEYYTRRGMSEQQAKEKFWLVDTKGLVTFDRGDKLAEHKKYFARSDNDGHQYKTLEEVIEYVKPSALVGLAATHGVFTEEIVRALKKSVDAGGPGRRPILFPLSNPLTKAECTFEEVSHIILRYHFIYLTQLFRLSRGRRGLQFSLQVPHSLHSLPGLVIQWPPTIPTKATMCKSHQKPKSIPTNNI